MTQKCYRVQFTAHLHKLTLALKMQCQIQILWKRGEKSASSEKVPLINGEVNFDKRISIPCNMIFNPKTKVFHEKITKFSIIITSQKGVKQAGEILFDVGQYVNQSQLSKKDYDERLTGCPDKHAKLTYTITGVMKGQISMDMISQQSQFNHENVPVLEQDKNTAMKKKPQTYNNYTQVPTQDKSKPERKDERLKQIEDQNKKMREQLKGSEKLRQQNEELRRKIKAEQFKKASEVKEKIQKYKKQIEKMKSEMRANKKIEDETLNIQKDIFKCKVKIMKAFNYARQFGGERLVDALHQNCGYT